MQRAQRFVLVLGLLALAAFGIAATKPGSVDGAIRWLQKGAFIGSTANQSDNHLITNSLGTAGATAVQVDIAVTASGACTDSATVTITGVKAGDTCDLGLPATAPLNLDAGAYAGSWSCRAVTDGVKVRFCNPTAVEIDPLDAGFTFRTFSNQ